MPTLMKDVESGIIEANELLSMISRPPEKPIIADRIHVDEQATGTPELLECIGRIGRRYSRTKPRFSDCWLVGDVDDLEPIETYYMPYGKVIVGNAPDGEIEYNLMPSEYGYSGDVIDMIGQCIDSIRDAYRTTGGRMDRQNLVALARGFFTKRSEVVSTIRGSDSDIMDAVMGELSDIVYRYTLGLGMFDILLEDPRLEDIYIDAPCDTNRIHVTVNQLSGFNSHVRCRTNLIVDKREVKNLINVLKRESGLAYCESHPTIETDMKERDARATVVGFPMSPYGDSVAIRKHSQRPWTLTRLIGNGTIDAATAGLLSFLVDNRTTFMICGSRGSGKSSLLSAMMFEFPISQRILTIEDTMELPGDKMRKMGYKVQSLLIDDRRNGDAMKKADETLRVSLRMGESAIVLGEVRGEEARTLYQSMRTGRAGSSIMGTIHGDSAISVYERVVHDIGIPAEAFMATDFLVTVNAVKERGTNSYTRRLGEFVSTSSVPGEFIDVSVSEGLMNCPPVKRILSTTGMTRASMREEIVARSEIRSFLAHMAETHGDEFYGPEWIVMANDHVTKELSDSSFTAEGAVERFKERFRRYNGFRE